MAHHSKQPACANCHYAFPVGEPDEFCSRCGQQNHDVDLRFAHVLEEGLEGIFHFDSKVFQTLKLLLFRPGELTRQFLAGHRVPFVPPIRLYVFISFVFFLALSLLSGHGDERKPLRETVAENQRAGRGKDVELIPGFRIQVRTDTAAPPQDTAGRPRAKAYFRAFGVQLDKFDFDKMPEELSAAQADSLLRGTGQAPTFTNRMVVRRAARWHNVSAENVKHQLLRGASLLLFLLMPLAALLLRGAYFRQRRYYLSHLIFTIHLQCFMFIALLLMALLGKVPVLDKASSLLWLVVWGYFVLALRRFYDQGWGRTLAKAVVLSGAYVLTVVFSMVAVALVGAAIF